MRQAAAAEDGAAAAEAMQRKRSRYGEGVGGVRVTTVACETWGRLGDEAVELVTQLAGHWASVSHAGPAAAAATARRWRAEVGVGLTRAQAATAAQACAPVFQQADSEFESEEDES
eukprot:7738603-Karenia_brevis.AAC.1